MPEMMAILVESYKEAEPFGAKSIAEIGINGALPVLSNGIYDAVSVGPHHAPPKVEKILIAIKEKQKEETAHKVPRLNSIKLATTFNTPGLISRDNSDLKI